jgi:tetratricopeptide (TPR) repeat protein
MTPRLSFYRALVEGRFGHETAAIEDLRKLLAAYADPDTERQAYEELASALVRVGHYGEAARAWADALRLTPLQDEDRADSENTRALDEALGDVAPQTIQFWERSAH